MGVADAVPGVSGGTIALIVGIYERLVDAIAGITEHGPALLADLAHGRRDGRIGAAKHGLRRMDVPFLVLLGLGVLTGVGALATVIDLALETYRAETFAVFFGIILASPLVLKDEVTLESRPVVAGVLGAAIAFVVSGLPAREADYALPALFLVGAVAICAMVLPGISGSLVLVIVGAYDTMTGAVSGVIHGIFDGPNLAALIDPVTTLVVFAAGALLGILTFARVVSWAIDTHRAVTMTFLVGVMLGALRAPYIEVSQNVGQLTPTVVGGLVVAAAIGAILVIGLDRVSGGI